ncbi:ATP-binding protein [Paeniglutamicibacter psychrophenolicus]|uniref:ATP-binding protein n=1 Tax=Paeniglutamicibacter psychrophenolicus TaxID=257454 RepID=UPI00277F9D0E|nr:ATP-binding protein [Paeniglutamicibacter psychrophenolicus]MDQ0092345.1 serine/threonine-protein kinase RsbW [Paeniglutamicibacter psychrophenolicus]
MTELIAARSFRDQAVPESIEAVHILLDELWADAPFVPDMDRMTFATAVIEAASNIVQHAMPEYPTPVELGVEISVRTHNLRAEISAFGATDPQLESATGSMPGPEAESGRGLALIRALVSTVTFVRQDGTNIWVLSRDSSPHV